MKIRILMLFLSFFAISQIISQTSNKFQRKITGFLSKDEVEKAINFCDSQKSEKDRQLCYAFMGEKALEEMDYKNAIGYFLKSKNKLKLYNAVVEAIKNGYRQSIDNELLAIEKSKESNDNITTANKNAFMPIADICYQQKDYGNAAYYYEKANIKHLSNECKVLHAIEKKDYTTVVEISEKEGVGILNTRMVYTNAANQYFENKEYGNAAKCYQKLGNKQKKKLSLFKENELEVFKTLDDIHKNTADVLINLEDFPRKLEAIKTKKETLKKLAKESEILGFQEEVATWERFAFQLEKTINCTEKGNYLMNAQLGEELTGKMLLNRIWKEINQMSGTNKYKITSEKLDLLEKNTELLGTIEKVFLFNVEKVAKKKISDSGIKTVGNYLQLSQAIENIDDLLKGYIIAIDSSGLTQTPAYQILYIIESMENQINESISSFIQNTNEKQKFEELQKAHQTFFCSQLELLSYLKESYQPISFGDMVFLNKLTQIQSNSCKLE